MQQFQSFEQFYPFYSLAADWVMYKDFLTGQLSHKLDAALAQH